VRKTRALCLVPASLLLAAACLAQSAQPVGGKPTKAANAAVLKSLPFADEADFEDARRGLIAKPETLTIRNAKGDVVWDLESYKAYLAPDAPAPDTVNPSLWRNAQLNMQYGLFEVTKGIYQVRGFDPSSITFVQGRILAPGPAASRRRAPTRSARCRPRCSSTTSRCASTARRPRAGSSISTSPSTTSGSSTGWSSRTRC
jgi:hypothetical protein